MRESIRDEQFKKIAALREHGLDPYPAKARRTHLISELLDLFAPLARESKKISIVGRVRAVRDQGGLIFFTVRDRSGTVQAVLKKATFKDFSFWKKQLDAGDFVEIGGTLFKTKRGEKSIDVRSIKMLTKVLRPLPKEFYGIEDTETKLRKRYLDILMSKDVEDLFVKKNIFWKTLRKELEENRFLEVETPILEAIPGGAEAEPFVTHHNALNTDYYLRISLEIALKKLMVAGYERVFEIGRVFRNEGIDAEHLQDYTALEFYMAYADYNDLMTFIQKMYKRVIKNTCGTLKTEFKGQKIDWSKKWEKIDYCDLFKKEYGIDLQTATKKELYERAKKEKLDVTQKLGKGRIIDILFKKIRPKLVQPCFLTNTPAEIEPLAKRIPNEPYKVQRFQIVAGGTELGKGFSEANDPVDQRERFKEQMKLREKGDAEAHRLDEDFIEALEYGMPPTAGFGLSERLFSVLMDKPIRETVFFPLMRRKGE